MRITNKFKKTNQTSNLSMTANKNKIYLNTDVGPQIEQKTSKSLSLIAQDCKYYIKSIVRAVVREHRKIKQEKLRKIIY